MKPMLDLARDLAGGTPETLALALLGRREPLRPSAGEEAVVGDQTPATETTAHESNDDDIAKAAVAARWSPPA